PGVGAQEAAIPTKAIHMTGPVVDGVDATDNPCTTSLFPNYVDMPGMSVTYAQGGTSPSKVIAMFQGEWIPNTGRAFLRLVIDGVVQTGPGDASSTFAAHDLSDDETNGFNFISDQQTQGVTHTAKIQWSTLNDQICVDERSLLIFHR